MGAWTADTYITAYYPRSSVETAELSIEHDAFCTYALLYVIAAVILHFLYLHMIHLVRTLFSTCKRQDVRSTAELPKCCICLDEEIDTIFFPCRHACCCSKCFSKVSECPMCRKPKGNDSGHIFFS